MHKAVVIIISIMAIRVHPKGGGAFIRTWVFDFIIPVALFAICIHRKRLNDFRGTILFEGSIALLMLLMAGAIGSNNPQYYTVNATRVLYIFLVYYLLYSITYSYNLKKGDMYNIFNITIGWNVLVSITQLIDVPYFSELGAYIWSVPKGRGLYAPSTRIGGTFMNANWFGVFLALSIVVLLEQYSKYKNKGSLILIFASMVCLIFTGSRTGIATCLIAVLVWISFTDKKMIAVGSTLGVMLAFVSGVLFIGSNNILSRFMKLFYIPIDQLSSVQGRIVSMNRGFNEFLKNPIFGNGYVEGIYHNSYITILNANGLYGMVIIMTIIIIILYHSIGTIDSKRLVVAIVVPYAIASMTAEYIYVTQLAFPVLIILAFTTKRSQTHT